MTHQKQFYSRALVAADDRKEIAIVVCAAKQKGGIKVQDTRCWRHRCIFIMKPQDKVWICRLFWFGLCPFSQTKPLTIIKPLQQAILQHIYWKSSLLLLAQIEQTGNKHHCHNPINTCKQNLAHVPQKAAHPGRSSPSSLCCWLIGGI